jgi:Uma2 family endonuclease
MLNIEQMEPKKSIAYSLSEKPYTDQVQEPDLAGTYTYADYLTWQFTEMVELIRGKIVKMSPAPRSLHQMVAGNLYGNVWSYLKGKKCKVFIAPFDVRLPMPKKGIADQDIITVVQPDLCIVCDRAKIDERGCVGAPDWIIEVLSPRTAGKDLNEKFELYEEAGVKEYWVVHPQEQTVLVYTLDTMGKYQGLLKPYTRRDKIQPLTFPALVVDLGEVFEEGD